MILEQRQSLPLEQKVTLTKVRIRQFYEHFDGNVYLSFSGGKDSTVLLHIIREVCRYDEIPAVFCDTGLEYPEVRDQVPTVCYAVQTGHTGANGSNVSENVAPTLDCASPCAVVFEEGCYCMADDYGKSAVDYDLSETLKVGGSQPIICLNDQGGSRMEVSEDMVGTLRSEAHGNNPIVSDGYVARRLTPTECERLQGFPDGWTKIDDSTKDAPRYRALGNSMAVPVMRWIGERIQKVDDLINGGDGQYDAD